MSILKVDEITDVAGTSGPRISNAKFTEELLATTVIDSHSAGTLSLNVSTRYCIIEMVGGGGGGASTANNWYGGGGGGAGAYSEFFLDVEDANWISDNGNSTTLYYDVASGSSIAGPGDVTTFSVATSTTIVSCAGGGAASGNTGGSGGAVTVTAKSYIYPIKNIDGQNGGNGVGNSATSTSVGQGYGGCSYAGPGGPAPHGNYTDTSSRDGIRGLLGGGGSGAVKAVSGGRTYRGSYGGVGRVIIREYA